MIWNREPNSALDIGTRTVKGVTLKKSGNKVILRDHLFVDLLKGRGYLPESQEAEQLVKAVLEASSWRSSWVGSVVQDNQFLTFELNLPKMPENEIRGAIENELEQKINFPLDKAIIEYVVLEDFPRNNSPVNVIAYCIKKHLILDQIELLQHLKMRTSLILPEAMANLETIKFNGYLDLPGYSIVVDIGDSHTTTSLIWNQQLLMSNATGIGSGSVNQSLANTNNMTCEDADALKLAHTFEEGTTSSTGIESEIDEAFSGILESIDKTIQYYRTCSKGSAIQGILLSGGGSMKSGLDKIFQENFRIPTTVVNPLRKIEIYQSGDNSDRVAKIAHHLGAAIGLALRGVA